MLVLTTRGDVVLDPVETLVAVRVQETCLARSTSHLVPRVVGQDQKQILVTQALDRVLGSNREKDDVPDADVEAGGDSRENNAGLRQERWRYSAATATRVLFHPAPAPAPR